MSTAGSNQDLHEVSLLADDVRRRLYDVVVAQSEAITREQAAAAAGVGRALAAYHLDRLAEAGLIEVGFARTPGRTGPGSGRPAKQYSRSSRELSVTLPPRDYALLARILATAVEGSASDRVGAALRGAAAEEGEALGRRSHTVPDALTVAGYEPVTDPAGDIVLRNCPFHSVVQEHTALVCSLNHAFVQGALAGAGEDPGRAELCPRAGHCCVVVHPVPSAPGGDLTGPATEQDGVS